MARKNPKTIEITDPRSWVIKGSVGTLVIFFGIIFASVQWGHKWLDMSFMTDSAYASDQAITNQKLSALEKEDRRMAQVMTEHFTQFDALTKNIQLGDAVDTYRDANQALYLHKLDEERNGATSRSKKRRLELEEEQRQAKDFRDCVINNRPNCESLRPR